MESRGDPAGPSSPGEAPVDRVAAATGDVDWHGHHISESRRVLLHVVATNHDQRTWDAPWSFRPERFLGLEPGPDEFVPQGGGDVRAGHRCPGEPAVVGALCFLAARLAGAPEGSGVLGFDSTRMPTMPEVIGGPGSFTTTR